MVKLKFNINSHSEHKQKVGANNMRTLLREFKKPGNLLPIDIRFLQGIFKEHPNEFLSSDHNDEKEAKLYDILLTKASDVTDKSKDDSDFKSKSHSFPLSNANNAEAEVNFRTPPIDN